MTEQERIAQRLHDARINAGLTVADAATRSGVRTSTLKSYESGNTEPSAVKITALAETYGVATDQLLRDRDGFPGADDPDDDEKRLRGPIAMALERRLRSGLESIGATSITVYVQDPFFHKELRLVLMPGVQVDEPMHGFLYPVSSAHQVNSGSDEPTFRIYREPVEYPEPLATLVASDPLFGDFATREGVRSWARFRHRECEGGEIAVVVNFNFADFDADRPDRIQAMTKAFEDVVRVSQDLRGELSAREVVSAQSLFRLLDENVNLVQDRPDFDHYIRGLLRESLLATGLSEDDGFGALFLAREGGGKLIKHPVHVGVPWGIEQEEFDTSKGEGIVSWVALKRRCLHVRNVSESRFREKIFLDLMGKSRSALAVPLIAGDDEDELLGVILIESREREIHPGSVRWLYKAANQAALAVRLFEMQKRTQTLLDLAHATSTDATVRPLEGLAKHIEESLGASGCDIWAWDPTVGEFHENGRSNYISEAGSAPRPHGCSRFIVTEKQAVWIEGADSEEFQPWFWMPEEERWSDERHPRFPDSNRDNLNSKVSCELGIPILQKTACLGVAWVKFTSAHPPRPTRAQMSTVTRLMSQASLVIGDVQTDSMKNMYDFLEKANREQRERLLPSKSYEGLPLEVHAIYEPFEAELGGDFYAIRRLEEHRTAFVIGDAEGHGIEGATRMLPLLTAAELSLSEAWSNRDILGKLQHVGQKWALNSTALAFQIEFDPHKKDWILSAASMGHPPLLIVKQGRRGFEEAPRLTLAKGPQIGLEELRPPVAEEFTTLEPGDCVIAFTDGIEEAAAQGNGALFEVAGIIRAVANAETADARGLAEAIMAGVRAHYSPARPRDDAAVVVVRIPEGSNGSR